MLIDLRDERNRPVLRLEVDPDRAPTLVRFGAPSTQHAVPQTAGDADPTELQAAAAPRTLTLDWDRAWDDGASLRRCPLCACDELYRRRVVPRVTLFAVVALGGVAGLMLARSGLLYAGAALAGVIALADLWVLLRFRPMLRCYRCGAAYRGLPLRRHHKSWDASTAKRAGAVTPPWLQTPVAKPAD
ncbi:MAG: hypothetical protein AAF288_08760 [Planctomycetota bacterium]